MTLVFFSWRSFFMSNGAPGDSGSEASAAALPPLEAPGRLERHHCNVCLEPMASDVALVTSLLPARPAAAIAAFCGAALRRPSCGHGFHAPCLERWASQRRAAATCPICRGPVSATGL